MQTSWQEFYSASSALRKKITLLFFLGVYSLALPVTSRAELKLLPSPIQSGRLAFTYYPDKDGKKADINIIDFGKGTIEPVINSPAREEYPSWSPEGTKLVFYSDQAGDREIFLAGSDGSGVKRLTTSRGSDEDPSWSPDGTKIVFQSERQSNGGTNLYIMNPDGSKPEPLTTSTKRNAVPRWSPRGTEIVYSTNTFWPGWDLMLYDVETKRAKLVTEGLQNFYRANWSPDGSALVFSYGSGNAIDLWIEKKGESDATVLTDLPGREYDPVWRDDGQGVFFAHELNKGEGDFQIFYIDLASKKTWQLTAGAGGVRYLSWTPLPAMPAVPIVEEAAAQEPAASTKPVVLTKPAIATN